MSSLATTAPSPEAWVKAATVSALKTEGRMKLRLNGKQIALFDTAHGIRACDNRCPHEGFPLSEGTVSPECLLTCNWHNWKFDLNTGDNAFGGDRLTVYPVAVRGAEIWIDVADPPLEKRQAAARENLRSAFDDYAYDRIGREIARLGDPETDPLEALRLSITWSWNRMEFGWTHAFAGMADWLTLYQEHEGDAETRLICLTEAVSHVAYDVQRERVYPYSEDTEPWNEAGFLAAIEAEDEATAIRMMRWAVEHGVDFFGLESALSRAALAHYNDFGHSIIYVSKARELIEGLGEEVKMPLLLSLVRAIVFASREDQIPEFRSYGPALDRWGRGTAPAPGVVDWAGKSVNQSLEALLGCSKLSAERLYPALLYANASNMLRFDIARQDKPHVSVSGNVNWLDFTHGLTFANAVRRQCVRYPELWPQGLLQMACFSGRNNTHTKDAVDQDRWFADDPKQAIHECISRVIDHDQSEHIVSVHLLKTALAVREEIRAAEDELAQILFASLNRFLNSPLRRRTPRRTAYQSMRFLSD